MKFVYIKLDKNAKEAFLLAVSVSGIKHTQIHATVLPSCGFVAK